MRLRYRSIAYLTGRPGQDDDLERLFQEAWSITRAPSRHDQSAWHPPLDMYETADQYVVRVEVAGARDEDLDISLFADRLVITGRRAPDHARNAEQIAYHLAGIRYGTFRIVLPAPRDIDPTAAEASYEGGFLTVTLPKQPPPSAQQTTINIRPSRRDERPPLGPGVGDGEQQEHGTARPFPA
ncbi:MAG: hypothetical protein NVSMB65_12740 [Chloroflexota bacterium]